MKALTRRGGIAVASGALLVALGVAIPSWLLGGIGLAILSAVAAAWLEGGAIRVTLAREVSSSTLTEGSRARVELRVSSVRPSRARVRESVAPGLAVVSGASEAELALPGTLAFEVEARAPGRWRLGPAEVTFSDALGLVEERVVVAGDVAIAVYPAVHALREVPAFSRMSLPLAGPHATGQAGPGADFYALRSYQDGDTMRDVNWRASARNAKGLVVNQREKESQAYVTFFLDARAVTAVGTPTENAWVETVRAFASLASHAARRRDRPRAVVYGDGVHGPFAARAGDASLGSVLDPVLDLPPAGDAGLAAAVAHALPVLRTNAPVFIVSAFLHDEGAGTAVASLRALGQHVTALAIDPRAHVERSGSEDAVAAKALAARERRLDALRANGARVVSWDPSEPLAVALAREALA